MSSAAITIKPHHFVDILADFGEGVTEFGPHPYGHGYGAVMARIVAEPDVELVIELGADDICRPCLHNAGGQCDDTIDTSFRPEAPTGKGDYNLIIDERWCERLGVAQGDRIGTAEMAGRIAAACDDLAPIYRENPADRVSAKAAALAAGAEWFTRRSENAV